MACEQAPTGLLWEQGWRVRGRGRERPGAGTCSQTISMSWSPCRVFPLWWPPSPDSHTGFSWEQRWGVRGRGRERPGAGTCPQAISISWSPYRVLPLWWPLSPDSHFPGRIGDKVQTCWHTSRQSQMQIKLHPTGKTNKFNQTQFTIQ